MPPPHNAAPPTRITGWMVQAPGQPMVPVQREEVPAEGEVLVQVAGCGVCHTDLGFFYDGVPTRHPFPLTLGHEVSGTVVATGGGADEWSGRRVVVPAVIPCGGCDACRAGRGQVCGSQTFLGSDVHGGFASHLKAPARGLCPVPDLGDPEANPAGLELATLSVVADAISTPYQAIHRSGLAEGELAVFVGVGGVGGFGVQIAAARGAAGGGMDVEAARLELIARHGADLVLDAAELSFKALRTAVRDFAEAREIPSFRRRIFETSGTPEGQATAFGLLGPGGYLSVVGFTPRKVELRLSNLMAYDARVQGNWGCLPKHYPAVVELALSGAIALEPFTERRPLSTINETFEEVHRGGASRRVILIPEP